MLYMSSIGNYLGPYIGTLLVTIRVAGTLGIAGDVSYFRFECGRYREAAEDSHSCQLCALMQCFAIKLRLCQLAVSVSRAPVDDAATYPSSPKPGI